MRYLPYNANLKTFSRDLRNNSTIGEILLWKQLRARQMMGYQFYRQKPLTKYIVDFYCPQLKLIIEVDGQYHNEDEQQVSDRERQDFLEEIKLNFLRFAEMVVRKKMPGVLKEIENYILTCEEKFPEIKSNAQRR